MTNSTTLNQIAMGVAQSIEPLQSYFTNDVAFITFMRSLGWNVYSIPTPIANLNNSINNTLNKLNNIVAGELDMQIKSGV